MYKITKDIEKNANDLNTLIDTLLKEVNELEANWVGYDSNIYCMTVNEYLNKIKEISTAYTKIEETIKNSIIDYKECDSKYAQAMKEVEVNNE